MPFIASAQEERSSRFMITLPGYHLSELIHEGSHSLVYRATRIADDMPVMLKVLRDEYPAPHLLECYRQEYQLIHRLNLPGVVKVHALEPYQHSLILVLEDFGGQALQHWIRSKHFQLDEALQLAIHITDCLAQLHNSGIIHRDLNPANIVYNPGNQEVKIIDFGVATAVNQNHDSGANQIIGTLAYISPEQTGRMHRVIDVRSDFYALGVTLYELLTGRLPFEEDDELSLIHAHLAKQPTPPQELDLHIPKVVSSIVLKLLAKAPETRYQSAEGLRADLYRCLRQLHKGVEPEPFSLGQQDVLDQLPLPTQLHGRATVQQQLQHTFEMACLGNTELVILSGAAGMGKSALVQTLVPLINAQQGYLAMGKFELMQRNVPYSAINKAFQHLLQHLLTENETRLDYWRNRLHKALGHNAADLVELVPDLERLIGKQTARTDTLDAVEAQNRFALAFQNFVRVFCLASHPLVIFLDDLQWADTASLDLVRLMLSDIPYLMVIVAHREGCPDSHFYQGCKQISQINITLSEIKLAPLSVADVQQWLAEVLHLPAEQTTPLATVVTEKTHGNPFFISEFLQSIYRDKHLRYIPPDADAQHSGDWQWDLAAIRHHHITDNVVALMVEKIQQLSDSCQNLLKLAACIGNPFCLPILSSLNRRSPEDTLTELWEAINQGLVSVRAAKESAVKDMPNSYVGDEYHFIHERVRQALYAMMSEAKKKRVHWEIGQQLCQNLPREEWHHHLFTLVDHLNFGLSIMPQHDLPMRNTLLELNLNAGRRAKTANAYQPASSYFAAGLKLLDNHSWQQQYDIALQLHLEAAQTAYLQGQYAQMGQLISVVLDQAHELLDKVRAYQIKILAHSAQGQLLEAVQLGLFVLRQLGMPIPEQPHPWQVNWRYWQLKWRLGRKPVVALLDLPDMHDPYAIATMQVIASLGSAPYIATPDLYPLLVFDRVSIPLHKGNSAAATHAYATFGIVLCGKIGDIKQGYAFGELALALSQRYSDNRYDAKVHLVFNAMIRHWREPLHTTLEPLLAAYHIGLENGDIEYAALALVYHNIHRFFNGDDIGNLAQYLAHQHTLLSRLRQDVSLKLLELLQQVVSNLRQPTDTPHLLNGRFFSERLHLDRYQTEGANNALFCIYLNKLMLAYLFAHYHQASEYSQAAEPYIRSVMGSVLVSEYIFYDALTCIALYPTQNPKRQQQLLRRLRAHQQRFQHWCEHAPDNYTAKLHLLQAELARINGQFYLARAQYDYAIQAAHQQQNLLNEALAYELAARFYGAQALAHFTHACMRSAHYAYQRWGALAKIKQLENQYPQLFNLNSQTEKKYITASETDVTPQRKLDLNSVLKAAQTIASEIHLGQLLHQLMKIVLENAGAQRGLLILKQSESWLIQAEATLETRQINTLQALPLSNNVLPLTLINYVKHLQESVVLNDAAKHGKFAHDSYIVQNQTRSILCVPLLNQGELVGIFYLENNLATGAFTSQRAEVLKLLSAQMAIAISNATLYADMQALNNKLKESETRFRLMIETAPVPMFITREQRGEIVYANPSAAEMFGIRRTEDFIGQHMLDFYSHPAERALILAAFKRDGQVNGYEVQMTKTDGNEFWVAMFVNRVVYKNEPVLLVSTFDLTPHKRVEEERLRFIQERNAKQAALTLNDQIEAQNQALIQLNQEKNEFMGIAAHDLKNPLNAILGLAEEIETCYDEMPPEEIIEVAGKIKRGSRQMFELITNLLDVNAIESGSVHLSVQPTDLIPIVNELLKRYQERARLKSIEIISHYDTSPYIALADDLTVRQVLENLLSNAVKYSANGTQITFNMRTTETHIRCEVHDQGPGLSAEDQTKLFGKFTRLTPKPTGNEHSTGLGLFIVKKLVEAMDGSVWCESELGQGALFVVALVKG